MHPQKSLKSTYTGNAAELCYSTVSFTSYYLMNYRHDATTCNKHYIGRPCERYRLGIVFRAVVYQRANIQANDS